MAERRELLAENAAAFDGFLLRFRKKLSENLEVLVGQKITVASNGAAIESEESLRPSLPASAGAALAGLEKNPGSPVLAVLDGRTAKAMVLLVRGVAPSELPTRLESQPHLVAEDMDAFGEIGGFLVSALSDAGRRTQGKDGVLRPSGCRHMIDSVWQAGPDPLASGAYLVARLALQIEGREAGTLIVAMPVGVAAAIVPDFAPPGGDSAPAAARDLAVVALIESEDLIHAVEGALGPGPRTVVKDEGALVGAVLGQSPSLLLVEIPPAKPWRLELLHALRATPGADRRRLVVFLGAPTRENVLRCGRMGFRNVLPASASRDEIKGRILART